MKSVPKLSVEEFKYYKDTVDKDIQEHNTQLKKYNRPDEVIEAYNGIFPDNKGDYTEDYLFVGAATALPSLFYQLPKVNIRPKCRPSLAFESAVLTSLINASLSDREKEENQLCIIDTFLPYGYAVMKNGYNSKTGKVKSPSILTGQVKSDKTNDMEGDVEYLEFEKAISIRQSPKTTYLDSSQPFGKGNRITFTYTRTLQQLIDSNLYDLSDNFISHYGARSKDKRLVDLTLFEHWTMKDGYAYKLCYVEGWPEEIKWIKTEYTYLPCSYLRFNKIGDVLYAISHGTLGLKAQKELNYLNEIWKKHIDNMRNQFAVYEEMLTESGKKTLSQNDIGGLVGTKQPLPASAIQPLQSASIDPALFGNIEATREYLKLIMSTSGGKMGGPESELATTERNKALGDVLRSSGLQDSIRDFMIDQVKQRIKCFIKFGTPEMIVKLTGENLTNPQTGKDITPDTEFQLGGELGFQIKDLLTGDIDTDYIFDVDIQSASRPDYPVIRKQLAEGIVLASKFGPQLQMSGKKANIDLMLKDYFSTFDAIPDAGKYISDMTEQDKAALIQSMTGMAPGGAPTEGAITQGAEQVKTGTEGLE